MGITKPFDEKTSAAEPVSQKCRKPVGYITVLAKGLTSFQLPIQNVKIVALCFDCAQTKKQSKIAKLR